MGGIEKWPGAPMETREQQKQRYAAEINEVRVLSEYLEKNKDALSLKDLYNIADKCRKTAMSLSKLEDSPWAAPLRLIEELFKEDASLTESKYFSSENKSDMKMFFSSKIRGHSTFEEAKKPLNWLWPIFWDLNTLLFEKMLISKDIGSPSGVSAAFDADQDNSKLVVTSSDTPGANGQRWILTKNNDWSFLWENKPSKTWATPWDFKIKMGFDSPELWKQLSFMYSRRTGVERRHERAIRTRSQAQDSLANVQVQKKLDDMIDQAYV